MFFIVIVFSVKVQKKYCETFSTTLSQITLKTLSPSLLCLSFIAARGSKLKAALYRMRNASQMKQEVFYYFQTLREQKESSVYVAGVFARMQWAKLYRLPACICIVRARSSGGRNRPVDSWRRQGYPLFRSLFDTILALSAPDQKSNVMQKLVCVTYKIQKE